MTSSCFAFILLNFLISAPMSFAVVDADAGGAASGGPIDALCCLFICPISSTHTDLLLSSVSTAVRQAESKPWRKSDSWNRL